LGQSIFQAAFSRKSLGGDIRGRHLTLRINYRTSHRIRMHAGRLLGPEIADVDGNIDFVGSEESQVRPWVPKAEGFISLLMTCFQKKQVDITCRLTGRPKKLRASELVVGQ